MKRTHRLLPLILALPACALEPIGSTRSEITNGELETGYLSVFALAYEGQGGCTGTCITPKVGTTATHCIAGDPASSFTALFGDDETQPSSILQVTAVATAPDGGDFALVAFAETCPATTPHNRTALEDHVGEAVVMVGFGVTTEEADDAGVKRSGTATLRSVDPAEVDGLEAGDLATSNVPAGTCNGDSGGPTFMTFGGVEYMVGVTSRGSLDPQGQEYPCGQGYSIAVRADTYASFIRDFIIEHDPGADPGDSDDPPGDSDDPPDDPDSPDGDPPADPEDDGEVSSACQIGGRSAPGGLLIIGLALLALLYRAERLPSVDRFHLASGYWRRRWRGRYYFRAATSEPPPPAPAATATRPDAPAANASSHGSN
jgi:hypothetical protein